MKYEEIKELRFKEGVAANDVIEQIKAGLGEMLERMDDSSFVKLKPVALKVGFVAQIGDESGSEEVYVCSTITSVDEQRLKEEFDIDEI